MKTDARDAEHLARLLKLDEIVEVTVPSVEQEAARDLVRAREDVRGDLMRARHRLLLRQGIVWTGGKAWTGRHDVWLRSQRFDLPGRQIAFDSAYETMTLTLDRRNRLDAAITEMTERSECTWPSYRPGSVNTWRRSCHTSRLPSSTRIRERGPAGSPVPRVHQR